MSGLTLAHVDPHLVGMHPVRLQHAFALLDQAVKSKVIPGAVALVGRKGKIVGQHVVGYSYQSHDQKIPTQWNTVYDCASLTKVVVTLPLLLVLLERGELTLDDSVSSFIPAFSSSEKDHVTIKHLLTHTSGLASYRNLYADRRSKEEILQAVYSEDLLSTPGKNMVYSDLGYIILGEIIAKVLGLSLDKAAQQYIFQPLDMTESGFCPSQELKARIAATEFIPDAGDYKWGVVHDENAHALGGVSGHAGLFSTAEDLAKYAIMWLSQGKAGDETIFSPVTILEATQSQTKDISAQRGLGWVLKGDAFDVSGDLFSAENYNHTGFTGTSICIDPRHDLFAILLTNRVHFGRNISINYLRKRFHNALMASIYNQ